MSNRIKPSEFIQKIFTYLEFLKVELDLYLNSMGEKCNFLK